MIMAQRYIFILKCANIFQVFLKMSVENSGIFYEYGADFATAGSKKYMQKVTKIVGGVDFFLTFAPVHHILYRRNPTYLGV